MVPSTPLSPDAAELARDYDAARRRSRAAMVAVEARIATHLALVNDLIEPRDDLPGFKLNLYGQAEAIPADLDDGPDVVPFRPRVPQPPRIA